jgi:hypothetical protein
MMMRIQYLRAGFSVAAVVFATMAIGATYQGMLGCTPHEVNQVAKTVTDAACTELEIIRPNNTVKMVCVVATELEHLVDILGVEKVQAMAKTPEGKALIVALARKGI